MKYISVTFQFLLASTSSAFSSNFKNNYHVVSTLNVNGMAKCSHVKSVPSQLFAKQKLQDEDIEEEIEIILMRHKPLDCIVEQTLSEVDEGAVFINHVTPGGNADNGGLIMGDVILDISEITDEVVSNSGWNFGIDTIRNFIACKPEHDPLRMRILRGSQVMARHEAILVEFCSLPGGTDEALDTFIDGVYSDSYDILEEEIPEKSVKDPAENILDNMFQMWSDEQVEVLNEEIPGDIKDS